MGPLRSRFLAERPGQAAEQPNLVCEFGVEHRFQSASIVSGEMEQWQRDKIALWQRNCEQFPDRVVWGTDLFTWDDLQPETFAEGMRAWQIASAGLDDETRQKVTHANRARLLGMG